MLIVLRIGVESDEGAGRGRLARACHGRLWRDTAHWVREILIFIRIGSNTSRYTDKCMR